MGETLGDGFQREFHAADADEEDLAGVGDEIHKCVDLCLIHVIEYVGELLHDDLFAVAERGGGLDSVFGNGCGGHDGFSLQYLYVINVVGD